MTWSVGIDPGISGAIAYLRDGEIEVYDMPVLDGRVNGYALAHTIVSFSGQFSRFFIEVPSTRPGQGAPATLTTGINYGIVLGVLQALERSVCHVTPAKWCADLHLPRTGKTSAEKRKAKEARRMRACEVFPSQSHLFARAKDDGRADAALIALWGSLQP